MTAEIECAGVVPARFCFGSLLEEIVSRSQHPFAADGIHATRA